MASAMPKTPIRPLDVGVDEPGKDRPAGEVVALTGRKLRGRGHRDDPAVPNHHPVVLDENGSTPRRSHAMRGIVAHD